MEKPEVGQTLYSLNVGNAARNCEQVITPMIVSKVGRKYFSCHPEGWKHESVFHIDSWAEKTEYISDHRLYANKCEWEAEKERKDLLTAIKDRFGIYGRTNDLSTDKLKQIFNIINE